MEPVLVRLTRAERLGADSPPAVRRNEGAAHNLRGGESSSIGMINLQGDLKGNAYRARIVFGM
jgi:hypothetical protein